MSFFDIFDKINREKKILIKWKTKINMMKIAACSHGTKHEISGTEFPVTMYLYYLGST